MTAVVELTLSIRLRTDEDNAAEIAARLLESVEDALGVEAAGRVVPSVVPSAGPAVRIDASARRVLVGGRPLSLTRLEFDLLLYLGTHPDVVHDRATLLTEVWGSRRDGVRTVDVHIRKLRAKFAPEPAPISTVRGVGYRFDGTPRVAIV
ncbi:winged helix-turn-helix domain-containing protein [Amycolatopsis sp. 195334CR]|uniref:winged helix-turn-helix domain-containing protein n=1 Tax=Amycolatopsis sp. 195334CR TaxID=2814588 RepID=UPI001A8D0BC4|nr:winged helix-turn-helix domain-containing protein [Amycolatopsis sp. 195334CR]MBN6040915.1 winged helix-turn-helix transcriptional regulator [Amycolatopsis sp. 195334CR]